MQITDVKVTQRKDEAIYGNCRIDGRERCFHLEVYYDDNPCSDYYSMWVRLEDKTTDTWEYPNTPNWVYNLAQLIGGIC